MKKKYLLPADFCSKHSYQTEKGCVKFKLKDVKYFAETYCNVDLKLVERWIVEEKMWELHREDVFFDVNGLPIYSYTDKPKCVSLF